MTSRVSEITCGNQPVVSDLFLERQVPLANPHCRGVIVERVDDGRKRPQCIVAADGSSIWDREWISAWIACPGIFEIDIVPDDDRIPWRGVTGSQHVARGGKVVKGSCRRTQ